MEWATKSPTSAGFGWPQRFCPRRTLPRLSLTRLSKLPEILRLDDCLKCRLLSAKRDGSK